MFKHRLYSSNQRHRSKLFNSQIDTRIHKCSVSGYQLETDYKMASVLPAKIDLLLPTILKILLKFSVAKQLKTSRQVGAIIIKNVSSSTIFQTYVRDQQLHSAIMNYNHLSNQCPEN